MTGSSRSRIHSAHGTNRVDGFFLYSPHQSLGEICRVAGLRVGGNRQQIVSPSRFFREKKHVLQFISFLSISSVKWPWAVSMIEQANQERV